MPDIEIINAQELHEDNRFGHRFTAHLTYEIEEEEDLVLRWYERTDVPYFNNIPGQEWTELVVDIGEGSEVFEPWFHREPGQLIIDLIYPPSINFQNEARQRTLDIFICLSAGPENAVWVRLRQELQYDENNNIQRQELIINNVEHGDNPLHPPGDRFQPFLIFQQELA